MKTRGIVATSHDGIVTLSGLHFLPFGVWTATGAAPCKAHDAHLLNRVMTFYKWSSENRFFSTKPSLGRKNANYGLFWQIAEYQHVVILTVPKPRICA